ncbi:MAG: hypothetical protein H0T17_02465 [Propionibacteriales bacterium]|nr:hypothetical protein [Propionibacteriales bacterium]
MSQHRPSPSESGDGIPPNSERTDGDPVYTEPAYGDTSSASKLPDHTDSSETTRPIPTTAGTSSRNQSGATSSDRDRDGDGVSDRDERRADDDRGLLPAASQQREAEGRRREEFGGFNIGAGFFGWLVAVALTILIASIVGAVAAAVGRSLNVDRTDAERQAGTFGLATAIALVVILMIAYYAGGYVAGRMSRYDGGRQGVGVWLIGLFITLVAVGIGYAFGNEYNIFDRVDLPSIPIPNDTLSRGGLITLAAVLIATLLAALAGGRMGQRYHRKIDRVGLQGEPY